MNVVEDRTLVYIYNQHSEDNHGHVEIEAKPNVKILQGNAMSETLQNGTFGGGVTHRIGSIRPRHGAQLSWRSEVKFHINVFTLRG